MKAERSQPKTAMRVVRPAPRCWLAFLPSPARLRLRASPPLVPVAAQFGVRRQSASGLPAALGVARAGDGALPPGGAAPRPSHPRRFAASQSGIALRLPPHSTSPASIFSPGPPPVPVAASRQSAAILQSPVAADVRRFSSNSQCRMSNAEWKSEPRHLGCYEGTAGQAFAAQTISSRTAIQPKTQTL